MRKHLLGLLAALSFLAPSVAAAQTCPAVAALPDSERRVAYLPSASTGPFSVTFAILGDSTDYSSWVEVWLNGVRLTGVTQWQLTIPAGTLATACRPITNASIVLTSPATGTLQIVGARRPRRTSQLAENQGVSARNFNQIITDLTSQNRETWDKINDVTGRAIVGVPGENLSTLLPATGRAGLLLGFDGGGQLSYYPATPFSAPMPANTIKGNNTAVSNPPGDLSVDQVDIMLGTRLTVNAQTGTTYTYLPADQHALVSTSNVASIASTLGVQASGFWFVTTDLGAGTNTVTCTACTINGAATLPMATGDGYFISSDGANYQAFQIGNWNKQGNDIQVAGRFSALDASQGNAVNLNGNGSVLASNYFASNNMVKNYASTHAGANVANAAITTLAPGSNSTSGDFGLLVSSQQLNYLTNATAGDFEGIWATVYQGANSTGNGITSALTKRANGSSVAATQAQAIEAETVLVNGSGPGAGTLAKVHWHQGELDAGNTKYGFGHSLEAQVGAWDTAYLGDANDQSGGTAGAVPSWNYLLRGRVARSDSNQYFAVTGGGHTSGSGRIASGVAAATITARAQFNDNAAAPAGLGAGTVIYAIGANATDAGIRLASYGSGKIPFLSFEKSNGTLASRSAILSADSIGQIQLGGYDGTLGFQTGALFNAFAGENWSNTAHGAGFSFLTTPNTTTATAEAGRFAPSGGFVVGYTTDPGIGVIGANVGFKVGASAGLSTTKTVRAAGGATDCTLIFTGGLLTGGSC